MTPQIQPRLDDFARRLHALEVELEELRGQAAVATWAEQNLVTESTEAAAERPAHEKVVEPPTRPRLTSPELVRALSCLDAGDVKTALELLERARRHGVAYRDHTELEQVLELAHEAGQATGGRREAAKRLVYALDQNIKFVKRMRGVETEEGAGVRWTAAPTAPPSPDRVSADSEPAFRMPELHVSDLLGARALALAGGCVTLLGIVFFFVLAVNRGWIGPAGRVGLGAAASACVFLAGFELRRRYGETHSALAAVAAGIAGGYATLLAAAALYDMLPDYAALGVAAAIAATGVVTALRWRTQIIAGLGLIGAMLVPVAVVAQGGLSALGTAFVAVMLAATATVAVRERWNGLLVAGMIASAPQIAALVFQAQYRAQAPTRIVVLAAVFSLLYLAIGIGYQLRSASARLGQLSTGPITGAALVAGASAARLYGTTTQRGTALLVIALVYALVATVFFSRRAWRDLSALLAAVAFTVGAIGLSEVLSGQPLAYAWAAEAAALAWLARRAREIRFQVWSGVYLALALGHVLIIDSPPRLLFVSGQHPAHGAAPAVALAAVALIFAAHARPWSETFVERVGVFARQLASFGAAHRLLRDAALWLAAVMSTYALSLGVLSLFASFDWGHVTLGAIWSALGAVVLVTGLLRKSAQLRDGGLVWVGAAGVLVVTHSAAALAPTPRAVSFLVVAAAFLGSAFAYQLRERHNGLARLTVGAMLISLGLTWDALAALLQGRTGAIDRQGAALLALAALYGVLAAAVFRRGTERGFSTLLWAAAVVLAAAAAAKLVGGTYLVLSWAAGGVALAWLSARVREQRLLLAAGGYTAAALAHTVVFEAPPSDLFAAHADPATGVPAVLIVAVAIGVVARHVRASGSHVRNLRGGSWWISGVFGVYAVSLSVLELLQRAFPHASLQTDFQRGHTAVSAFWGLLGLALLYLGLTHWRSLRIAGFVLFAVSLAKIFLYDLPSLSSITRALSFLAVGAVLLLGGFFYQRLTASRDEEPPPGDLVPRAGM